MKGRIERLGVTPDTQTGRKELAALLREKNVSHDTLMIAARTLEKDSFLIEEMAVKNMGLRRKIAELTARLEIVQADGGVEHV